MTARYLVTGGAGYVGSHLVAALLERGLSVTVIDDLSTGHRAAVLAGVRLVEGDLADPSVLDPVLADGPWEAVFHFAALSLVGDSMREPFRYIAEQCRHRRAADRGLRAPRRAALRAVLHRGAVRPARAPADRRRHARSTPARPMARASRCWSGRLLWADRVHGLRSACLRYFNAAGADPEAGSARTTIPRPT